MFPSASFAFLPADMVSQILNFGVPAPIDLQIVGSDVQANRKYGNALLARIRRIPGIADAIEGNEQLSCSEMTGFRALLERWCGNLGRLRRASGSGPAR